MSTRPPPRRLFTSSGRALTATAASSYMIGWWLGWTELMILGVGGALALAMAMFFVLGKPSLSVRRRLDQDLVSVGEEVGAIIEIVNNGRSSAAPTVIEEQVGNRLVETPLPNLAVGERWSHRIELPTDRRGVVSVGPSRVTRRDPLHLLCRAVSHNPVDQLWVRPRVVPLRSVPNGRARGLEGASSESSPAGDVSFHTLREYQVGDDPRHVHWLSSARTGTLMVRQYVDNRVPEVAVLLDTTTKNWREECFEIATEIAASVAVSSIANHTPTSLRFTTDDQAVGGRDRSDRHRADRAAVEEVLQALTLVEPTEVRPETRPALPVQIELATAARPTCALVVAITGDRDPAEWAAIQGITGGPPVVLVRVQSDEPDGRRGSYGAASSGPGSVALDVASLEEFKQAWDREML